MFNVDFHYFLHMFTGTRPTSPLQTMNQISSNKAYLQNNNQGKVASSC